MSAFNSKILTGLALFVAVFVVGYFFTAKTYTDYTAAQGKFSTTKLAVDELQSELAATDAYVKEYQDKLSEAATLNLALPAHSSDLSNFTAGLGELAQQSGIVLSSLQVQEGIAGNNQKVLADNTIQPVSINLTATGSYASFKDFVLRLEQHLRLMDVTHVTLKSDNTGNLQYLLTIQTYYQK